ncbi:membrane protein insertion efficiency factor YidD [Enterococcus cecorum]|uniref:membrane protein insertion efficiency factor YidD n=1 Tax=Enterococcus cecorum TaxID=44008 RepID=UPI003D72876E
MIFMVRLYQLWAPEMMRKSCLYTPSCSEYMILSIEKYGCVKGFIKGVNRLRRCHYPNGGIDYP